MINKIQLTTPSRISFKQAYRSNDGYRSYTSKYNYDQNYDYDATGSGSDKRTCLDCYDYSRVGYIPRYPNRSDYSVRDSRGLIGAISNSIDTGRANRYEHMRERVVPVETTVSNYIRSNPRLAKIREESIADFERFRECYYKYNDYLDHVNPVYMRRPTSSIDTFDFFGADSKVFYTNGRRTVPYSREVFVTNVPFAVAIRPRMGVRDEFYGAKELYDFQKGIMFDNVNFGIGNYTSADQVNVFSPKKCDMLFAKLARAFRSPITINGLSAKGNGNFKANSLIVYNYDKYGDVAGTKVFVKPEVEYYFSESDVPEFLLNGQSMIESEFKGQNGRNVRFLEAPNVKYSNGRFIVKADQALELQRNGLASYYSNYDDNSRKLRYETRQVIDLNRG